MPKKKKKEQRQNKSKRVLKKLLREIAGPRARFGLARRDLKLISERDAARLNTLLSEAETAVQDD